MQIGSKMDEISKFEYSSIKNLGEKCTQVNSLQIFSKFPGKTSEAVDV